MRKLIKILAWILIPLIVLLIALLSYGYYKISNDWKNKFSKEKMEEMANIINSTNTLSENFYKAFDAVYPNQRNKTIREITIPYWRNEVHRGMKKNSAYVNGAFSNSIYAAKYLRNGISPELHQIVDYSTAFGLEEFVSPQKCLDYIMNSQEIEHLSTRYLNKPLAQLSFEENVALLLFIRPQINFHTKIDLSNLLNDKLKEELLSDFKTRKPKELLAIKNEIYARRGYIFKSNEINPSANKTWYNPHLENVENIFREFEKLNFELIEKAGNSANENLSQQMFTNNSNGFIENFSLPFQLKTIVDLFGEPDSTLFDIEGDCPMGQFHFWNFQDKNLTLITLEDNYDSTLNYDNSCRLAIYKAMDKDSTILYPDFHDIKINSTELDMRFKAIKFISTHKDFKLDTYNSQNQLFHLFCENTSKIVELNNDDIYYYFVFNKEGRLELIIQSIFEVRAAC